MKKILFSLVLCGLSFTTASAQYVRSTEQAALANEVSTITSGVSTTNAAAALPLSNELSAPSSTSTWLDAPFTTTNATALEAPRGRRQAATRRRFVPRFAALADLGIGGVIDANATFGAQLAPMFYIGGGLNVSYWHDGFTEQRNRADISVIFNPRLEIPTRSRVTPFFDLKAGYALTHNNGAYVALGTGVMIDNFTIGLAYSAQSTNEGYETFDRHRNWVLYSNYVYEAFTLRLGMKF